MNDRAALNGLGRARRRAGKSQDDVAMAVAMSKSGVQHLEMARHSLRVEQLPAFAVAIGCTVRELLIHMQLVRDRQAPKRRNPGQTAGAVGDGSTLGDRSTVCDPRGDASHSHPTAQTAPTGAPDSSSEAS